MAKLISTKDAIHLGVSTEVNFEVSYNNQDSRDIVLLKKSGENIVPYEVSGKRFVLKDDGEQEKGDLLQGDGIHSITVSIKETVEGNLEFLAGVWNEKENQWKAISEVTSVFVVNPFTKEELEVVTTTTQGIQGKIDALLQDGDKEEQEIKEQLISELKVTQGIKDVGISESGKSIWYALDAGVLGAVSLKKQESISSFNSVIETTTQYNITSINTQNISSTTEGNNENKIGNQSVGIFSAHGHTKGQEVSNLLKASQEIPFQVKYLKDEKVTVEEFKKLNTYGVIFFDTHGDALFKGDLTKKFPYLNNLFAKEEEKIIILTGEKVTEESAKNYNADLKTGRLVIVDDYYAITSAFVEHYGNKKGVKMPRSFVYANSNQSMHNDTLGKAFIESGAQTYVGHVGEVNSEDILNTLKAMLEGSTVGVAINNPKKILGNEKLIFTVPKDSINGGLEERLNGWIGAGHVDTIASLGINQNPQWATLKPIEGNKMGIISSGIDKEALDGRLSWVYQTFKVPEGVTALKFDYNVVSAEPMEFIDSEYDDKFKATIVEGVVKEPQGSSNEDMIYSAFMEQRPTLLRERSKRSISSEGMSKVNYVSNNSSWLKDTVDENEIVIGFESINTSDWGQDYGDDRQRVDIVFPHSNADQTTYMTGWKRVTYDVSKYQGKTITLKLQTWDLGDTIYPTAVLFDNVHFSKSNHEGIDIQGQNKVYIPPSGQIKKTYKAVEKDQYGDSWTGDIKLEDDGEGFVKPIYSLNQKIILKENVPGVSLDSNTGILTVSSNALPGEITLVASENGKVKEFKVQLLPAEIASVKIEGSDLIISPLGQEKVIHWFNANAKDQNGMTMQGEEVIWTLKENIKGISIDKITGELTLDPQTLEQKPYVTIVATSKNNSAVYAEKKVKISYLPTEITFTQMKVGEGDIYFKAELEDSLGGSVFMEDLFGFGVDFVDSKVIIIDKDKNEIQLPFSAFDQDGVYFYVYGIDLEKHDIDNFDKMKIILRGNAAGVDWEIESKEQPIPEALYTEF